MDLASSVEDCLRYLWPKLKEGCKFYTHEPWSINVVSLFFNNKWWKKNLKTSPPGLYGFGRGIKKGLIFTGLGHTIKLNKDKVIKYGERIKINH